MPQPQWQTPAGSLGTIPELVFFSQRLLATTEPNPVPAICTATTAGSNLISCDTIEPLELGHVIIFYGVPFGGIINNTAYYVLSIQAPNQFQITDTPGGTQPVVLTTATGVLTGVISPCVYYQLQAGTTPEGIQIATNGACYGVPQATATVQGVPVNVNRNITDKFTVRAYTKNNDGSVDRFIDRTFSLTIVADSGRQHRHLLRQ